MQKQVSCDLNPNVGTLQEVVFGYVGEGAKPLGEPPPEFPRKARLGRSTGPPLHWTANHRNEVGEIAFGKSAPDPQLAAHRRRGVPVPPHQIPANADGHRGRTRSSGTRSPLSGRVRQRAAVGGRRRRRARRQAVMAAAAASARREREARERGMSSGGLQFNGASCRTRRRRARQRHTTNTPHTRSTTRRPRQPRVQGPEAIDPKSRRREPPLHSVVSGLPLASRTTAAARRSSSPTTRAPPSGSTTGLRRRRTSR